MLDFSDHRSLMGDRDPEQYGVDLEKSGFAEDIQRALDQSLKVSTDPSVEEIYHGKWGFSVDGAEKRL